MIFTCQQCKQRGTRRQSERASVRAYQGKDDLAVRLRLERVRRLELLLEGLVVVDLPVHAQDHQVVVAACQRLCTALNVHDGKALVTEHVVLVRRNAAPVGAAVAQPSVVSVFTFSVSRRLCARGRAQACRRRQAQSQRTPRQAKRPAYFLDRWSAFWRMAAMSPW